MKITSKGQVTIPQEIREQFGFLPDTEIEFVVSDGVVTVVKSRKGKKSRGERIVSQLRTTATPIMTTEEIMKLTRG